ncbi:MAG: hypothetical protein Q7W05_05645, partial [Deltaproteobacteria bacterium]|nr:hypothetical protein [Deltaproteobacteria bacterium]
MTGHPPRVGAPDPELKTSPIFDEYEEISLDLELEAGACYFNDVAYFYFVRLIFKHLPMSYDIMQHVVYMKLYGVVNNHDNSNMSIAFARWWR